METKLQEIQKNIENLQIVIINHKERIMLLENYSKCYNCNNIELLYSCYKCYEKICILCCIVKETKSCTGENICHSFCKNCKCK